MGRKATTWRARAAGVALLSNLEDGTFGRRPADLVVDPNVGAEETRRDGGPVLLRGTRWAGVRRSVTERAGRAVIGDRRAGFSWSWVARTSTA